MTSMGTVEVHKDGSKLWYIGRIVDVGSSKVTVAFEGDVWPKADFAFEDIRKPPRMSAQDLEEFDPALGDEVELKVSATETSPCGWGAAVIRNIKHGFYFVARTSAGHQETSEDIVEKDKLRPVQAGASILRSTLKAETYKLPPELQAWVTTPDAMGCFSHIEDQAGLLLMQIQKQSLKLHGTVKAIARAKMLLEVHVKHQVKIQSFQDMREKGLKALESKRSRIEGTGYKHSCEFQVDPSFIARIIGKGGENISLTQKKHDVNIRILESDDPNEDRTVRIFGNTQESIESAKADIEFVEDSLDAEPQMYSWILGRGGKTIQGFKESCNLVYAKLDRDAGKLIICGTRAGVHEAIAMFETHMMYYPVFNQMDEEMEQIIAHLEEYGDYNARWEWGWYRDEEDDWGTKGSKGGGWGGGGKGSKGGGKSKDWGKGGGGKDWGRDSGYGGKDGGKESKGGKDGGKDSKGGKDGGKDSKGGKEGKGKDSKGGKEGKDGGKDGGKDDKGGKGKKGKGKSKKDDEWEEEEEEEDEQEDEDETPPPAKGKKGKGKGGKQWQAKEEPAKDEEEEEEDDDDDDDESDGKGKGKGRGARPPRSSRVARSEGGGAASSAPLGRRMGKKGVRH